MCKNGDGVVLCGAEEWTQWCGQATGRREGQVFDNQRSEEHRGVADKTVIVGDVRHCRCEPVTDLTSLVAERAWESAVVFVELRRTARCRPAVWRRRAIEHVHMTVTCLVCFVGTIAAASFQCRAQSPVHCSDGLPIVSEKFLPK